MKLISLFSFELCCTQIYNRHTHTHTYTQRHFSENWELRNIKNHRNLGVEKFHRYKAFSLRKQYDGCFALYFVIGYYRNFRLISDEH